jgi:hypothetical protein
MIDTLAQTDVIEEDPMELSDESSGESEDETAGKQPGSNSQSQPSMSQQTGRLTYGQQRSYLAEKDEEAMFDALMDDFADPLVPSQSQNLYDIDEDMEDESQQGQPRSVHDLRAAGSKKRILHALESLIAGVGGEGFGSMSSRRSCLVELVTKLQDSATATTLLDHGLERSLVATFASTPDIVFSFLAAIVVTQLAQSTQSLGVLRSILQSGFFSQLLDLLPIDDDISRVVKDRRYNMSKIGQNSITAVKDLILSSHTWAQDKPASFSPRIIAIKAVDATVRNLRELGGDDIVLDESSIGTLLALLENESSTPESQTYELVFSILESSSIGATRATRGPWTQKGHRALVKILSNVFATNVGSRSTRHLALKLTLNLTNNNGKASDVFATPMVVRTLCSLIIQDFSNISTQQTSTDGISSLDELILSLGAMINLAEISDKARLSILASDSDTALIRQLVQTFLIRSSDKMVEADSVEASQANVPYGYLSLLLVNLCQNETVRRHIVGAMPAAGLRELVDTAEEFIRIHQKTDRELVDQVGAEVHETYTNRLLNMVERLKAVGVEA